MIPEVSRCVLGHFLHAAHISDCLTLSTLSPTVLEETGFPGSLNMVKIKQFKNNTN